MVDTQQCGSQRPFGRTGRVFGNYRSQRLALGRRARVHEL
jgi:hypothetical protein